MVKFKKLKTVLTSLLLAGALAGAAAVAVTTGGVTKAYAADRQVELDGNSVFYRAIRGAEISASKPETENEKEVSFVKFEIGDEQSVTYRQNLAYTWLTGDRVDGYLTGTASRNYFSMSLSFESLNFKRFIVKLQSQQYVLTKDGKTDNYIIFTPSEDGQQLTVSVAQTLDEEEGKIKDEQVYEATVYAKDDVFNLAFANYENGDYELKINDVATGLKIKNVYEQFATYVSTGDTAVTPLTFSAQFAESSEDNNAEMVLRSINGQSFEVVNRSDVESGNANPKVADNASPVMCFTETPSYLKYGDSISLKYKVIDVLASAPRATAYYYVLTGEQYAADDFVYDKTKSEYEEEEKDDNNDGGSDGDTSGDETKKWTNPFIQVSSSSGSRVIRDDKTFNPQLDSVYGLVKIYYEISDVSGSSRKDDVVFVDWYAKQDALVNIYSEDYKGGAGTSNFIKLIDDKQGATYAQESIYSDALTTDEQVLDAYKQSVKEFEDYYAAEIEAAIEKLDGGKLYAGGEKFYLPAIEWDFMDDYFTARDYKYSVYYKAKSSGSNTSMEANKLAMDLNDADVTYTFTIYITDSFGNDMRYPAGIDDDGGIIWEKITTSDVWEDDFADLLPRFSFDVSYKKATAENPENLSLAYVNTNYSGVSFTITGVSDTYSTDYKLYVFDRNEFNSKEGKNLTYSEFVDNFNKLFNNTYEGVTNSRKYFTTVKAASDLLETDANYKQFKALNWNSSTLNFTPQSVEEFYVVELTLTDNRSQETSKNFATVAASVQTKALKGESDWLQQNLTSVILLSVAGVCLIALLVLLIVKPKDKGDIDAVYAEVEEKEEKKGKKSK